MSWNTLDPKTRGDLARALTPRQLDVYRLRLAGCSWDFIAETYGISIRTTRMHHKRATQKHQQLEPNNQEVA